MSHVITDGQPLLNVADVARSVAFYRKLGFIPRQTQDDGGTPVWAFLHSGRVGLMLNRQDRISADRRRARPDYGDMVFYFYCEDARRLRAELQAQGVACGELRREPYGLDEFRLRDPDGYELAIGSEAC